MGPSSSQRLRELFDRYIRRDLPPFEVEELVSLLGQADAEEALSEPMRRLWEEMRSGPGEYAVDWDRMYGQVSQADEGLSVLSERRDGAEFWRHGGEAMWRSSWGWRATAAVFLGLAGLAAYWSVAYRRPVAAGVAGAPAAVVVKKDIVRKTGAMSWQTLGNKKVVHLPDGSIVILNKSSTMTYRTGETGARDIVLNGEAYFDIVHRAEQPFLVHTGKILTRVLGTTFNIKAYPMERSIEVTVDHGKVQVLNGGTNMGLLSDKQQIRYDLGRESCQTHRVSLQPVMAWKPVEISFDDITMAEAARRIGERFKVGFNFVNPVLKECRITATFYMEDDLDQIMTVICGVNQSRFAIGGNTVKIDGKGCN